MSFVVDGGAADLAGVTFEQVGLKMAGHERKGAIVFTHRGISGPALFVISAYTAWEKLDPTSQNILYIDFKPNLTQESSGRGVAGCNGKGWGEKLINILDYFLPKSLAAILLAEARIDGDKKAAEIGKKDRLAIVSLIKSWPRKVVGERREKNLSQLVVLILQR